MIEGGKGKAICGKLICVNSEQVIFWEWKELLMISVWKVQNKTVLVSDVGRVVPVQVFTSL